MKFLEIKNSQYMDESNPCYRNVDSISTICPKGDIVTIVTKDGRLYRSVVKEDILFSFLNGQSDSQFLELPLV